MGLNLYAYCANNPITNVDHFGNEWWNPLSWDWRDIADKVVTTCANVAGYTKGFFTAVKVFYITKNPLIGIEAGMAKGAETTGTINNIINSIYYNWFSDGISDLNNSSYQSGYINRWDRLDYTKYRTQESKYNMNAWRYYSEYSLHMYGWFAFGWAKDKNIPILSKIADRCKEYDENIGAWDNRWYVNLGTIVFGLLGL